MQDNSIPKTVPPPSMRKRHCSDDFIASRISNINPILHGDPTTSYSPQTADFQNMHNLSPREKNTKIGCSVKNKIGLLERLLENSSMFPRDEASTFSDSTFEVLPTAQNISPSVNEIYAAVRMNLNKLQKFRKTILSSISLHKRDKCNPQLKKTCLSTQFQCKPEKDSNVMSSNFYGGIFEANKSNTKDQSDRMSAITDDRVKQVCDDANLKSIKISEESCTKIEDANYKCKPGTSHQGVLKVKKNKEMPAEKYEVSLVKHAPEVKTFDNSENISSKHVKENNDLNKGDIFIQKFNKDKVNSKRSVILQTNQDRPIISAKVATPKYICEEKSIRIIDDPLHNQVKEALEALIQTVSSPKQSKTIRLKPKTCITGENHLSENNSRASFRSDPGKSPNLKLIRLNFEHFEKKRKLDDKNLEDIQIEILQEIKVFADDISDASRMSSIMDYVLYTKISDLDDLIESHDQLCCLAKSCYRLLVMCLGRAINVAYMTDNFLKFKNKHADDPIKFLNRYLKNYQYKFKIFNLGEDTASKIRNLQN